MKYNRRFQASAFHHNSREPMGTFLCEEDSSNTATEGVEVEKEARGVEKASWSSGWALGVRAGCGSTKGGRACKGVHHTKQAEALALVVAAVVTTDSGERRAWSP